MKDKFTNLPKNTQLAIILVVFLGVVFGVFQFVQSRRFRLVGIEPGGNSIGINTNVVLRFNKQITNAQEVVESITLNPDIKNNVFVEGTGIVIAPVGSFEPTKYEVSIKKVAAGGQSLDNFKTKFSVNKNAPEDNPKTSQDLDDIAIKKYPNLSKIENASDKYKIQYGFSETSVVFDVYLIESGGTDDEQKAIDDLRKTNQEMLTFIDSLGIPRDNYIVRYQNKTQERLIYGLPAEN